MEEEGPEQAEQFERAEQVERAEAAGPERVEQVERAEHAKERAEAKVEEAALLHSASEKLICIPGNGPDCRQRKPCSIPTTDAIRSSGYPSLYKMSMVRTSSEENWPGTWL